VRIVIDASVALKWVLDEPGSEAAIAVHADDLIAPVLWLAEAANALWRRVRIGDIAGDEAVARFTALANAPVQSVAIEPHLGRALNIANEIGHPVYDCLYLALALHFETHVVTADRRLAAVADRAGIAALVRLLNP
jgi:predicted nucleic acid-binding protein